MNKVQSIGTYWNNPLEEKEYARIRDYANWAKILRNFWNSIKDYSSLQPDNSIIKKGPGNKRYALVSDSEVILYFESGPKRYNILFPPSRLEVVLKGWKGCEYEIWDPKRGIISKNFLPLKNGIFSISLPPFLDDLAIRILKK